MRKHRVKRPDEAALRRLLEQEQASPEGAVLRLARRALDRGGLAGVQLMDLRHDWILRCLKEQDWPTVARISGVAVPALQARFSALVTPQKTEAEARSATLDEFRLWKILQVEKRTPAGLALWLAWQMGLRAGEIAALTWDQVDLAEGALCLEGRTVPLTNAVCRLLTEERSRRTPETRRCWHGRRRRAPFHGGMPWSCWGCPGRRLTAVFAA